MTAENWVRLNEAVEIIKGAKSAMRLGSVKYAIRELETVIDAESDDDEKPSVDD